MGTFRQRIQVAHPAAPDRSVDVDAIADSGALYTWIPGDRLTALGLSPTDTRDFQLADGRIIDRPICEATIRIDGKSCTRICVFGDPGSLPLLGADTLEGFSLAVDPVRKRLIPVPALACRAS